MRFNYLYKIFCIIPLFFGGLLFLQSEETYTDVSKEQIEALSHLVKALKDIKKVMVNRPLPDNSQNPFDEKQEFVMPSRPEAENMAEKLSDMKENNVKTSELIRKEKEKEQKTAESPPQTGNTSPSAPENGNAENEKKESGGEEIKQTRDSLADAMEKLRRELDALARRPSVDREDSSSLKNLSEQAGKIGKEVRRDNLDEALILQQKEDAEMKKTLEKIKEKSDARTRAEFEKARALADSLARSPGLDKARKFAAASESLAAASADEHARGTFDNSERLAGAAREMHDEAKHSDKNGGADNPTPTRENQLKNRLLEIQHSQKNTVRLASETLERAEILADELKFLSRGGRADAVPADFKKLSDEMSRSLEDMEYALQNLPSGDGKMEAGSAPEGKGTGQGKGEGGASFSAGAEALIDKMYKSSRAPVLPSGAEMKKFRDDYLRLMDSGAQHLREFRTREMIESCTPEAVPEKYREDVPLYFQRLSAGEKQHGETTAK